LAIESLSALFSYCREDSDFALRLAKDLKAAGAKVWIDQLDIEPGTSWDRAVEDALNKCQHMLVILSPDSVKSENVLNEVAIALRKQKKVIPVLYRECDIPLQLVRLQQVDFRFDYDRGLKGLLKTLTAAAARKRSRLATEDEDARHRLLAKPGNFNFYPVILAGGRGTRFWPLSRKRMAKQLLPLNGKKSMIQETVERLFPLARSKQFWIITNGDLRDAIVRQLKGVPKQQIVAEPVGRNTAPAIGLAACLLARRDPQAVIGIFPSDHVITDEEHFREDIRLAGEIAASNENIVVIGIPPTRAETGYGYIETRGHAAQKGVLQVRRFTEKPALILAEQFSKSRDYFWNSGMFVWKAQTLINALHEHLPYTAQLLGEIAASYGTRGFERIFARLYPKCENISIDYAVLEPRSARGEGKSGIYCIPATFGWNDLGSWTALYEHRSSGKDENVICAPRSFILNAEGNFIHSERKFVAAVGVRNLVVVETDDALLITTLEHSQDVGKVVKYLDEKKLKRLV
jgi:mannose-1-phosphate guanylyltransferase